MNAGVAPCYPGGFVTITLKDDKNGFVAVLLDESWNVRDLKPGPPDQAPTQQHTAELVCGQVAPTTRPGDYDLYVSVGARDGTPQIALPLAEDDGQRRYKLGRTTLRAER